MSISVAQKIAVSNGTVPTLSQVYAFSVSLTANVVETIDLRSALYQMNIGAVQSVFIDNSVGAQTLYVGGSSLQPYVIPPGYQAFLPFFVSAAMTMTLLGAGSVNISLHNFRTDACVWPTASQTFNQMGSGGIAVPFYAGTRAFTGTISTATSKTIITGLPSCYVTGIYIALSPETYTTTGYNFVTLGFTTAGVIYSGYTSFPTTAPEPPTDTQLIFNQSGLCLLGAPTDDLYISCSETMPVGEVRYSIFGGTN